VKNITSEAHSFTIGEKGGRAFTLIELLVVLAVISVLMAVFVPALSKVRRKAGLVECMRNQREIIYAVELFSTDNSSRYPAFAAKRGVAHNWHWDWPTMLTGYYRRYPGPHRAMSHYLRDYIKDTSIMFCPNAPRKYKYLQHAWDAGDDWSHPGTPKPDPVFGTYCFYWNYVGFLEEPQGPFKGPWGPSYARRRSKLLVTDYFGYDHWRSPNSYGSSERFEAANITEGTDVSSAYWSVANSDDGVRAETLKVVLHAGYQDGHVESYRASEVVAMWVSTTPDGSEPDTIGPGIFYLPTNALR
jgi:prepilin-type N-terminal cleavage/methylation domain-containing protein